MGSERLNEVVERARCLAEAERRERDAEQARDLAAESYAKAGGVLNKVELVWHDARAERVKAQAALQAAVDTAAG